MRASGALSGYFDLADRSWDWDVGYLYNQNKGVQVGTGNLNLAAVRMAVGPSFLNGQGVVQCGTPDNPIPLGTSQGECTPWNPLLPFGYGGPGDGSATDPAVKQFIFPVGQAISMTKTQDYFANLTGTLMANTIAAEISQAVRHFAFKPQQQQDSIFHSVSIGIAFSCGQSATADTPDTLIARATHALLRAKEQRDLHQPRAA